MQGKNQSVLAGERTHENTATWQDGKLTHVAYFSPEIAQYYRDARPEADGWLCEVVVYQRVPMTAESTYFVAADGDCYALKVESGSSCMNSVEKALILAGCKQVYVIFALRSKGAAALKAWCSKWAKRTTGEINRWDSSVRAA